MNRTAQRAGAALGGPDGGVQFWSSRLDLLSRPSLLLGQREKSNAIFSTAGFLAPADYDPRSVAEAGRLIGAVFHTLKNLGTAGLALPFLGFAIGESLGRAGFFNYQRESNFIA